MLEEKGAIVEEFDLSLVEYAIPAYYVIACAERMASIFIKMADRMQSSVKCWQVKSADALTAIRFCMSRGCLRTSQFPSAKL